MKRKLTMRIVSATVATQMLLTPVAHAASPLRDLVVTDQMERAAHNFIPMANYKQERAWGDMLHQANEITDGSTNVVATLEQVAAPEFILDSELEKELITPVVGDFPQNQPMESTFEEEKGDVTTLPNILENQEVGPHESPLPTEAGDEMGNIGNTESDTSIVMPEEPGDANDFLSEEGEQGGEAPEEGGKFPDEDAGVPQEDLETGNFDGGSEDGEDVPSEEEKDVEGLVDEDAALDLGDSRAEEINGGMSDIDHFLKIYGYGGYGIFENENSDAEYSYNLEWEHDWPTDSAGEIKYGSTQVYHAQYEGYQEGWIPDDTFGWDGEKTFAGEGLGLDDLPRVPNKEFAGWYVLDHGGDHESSGMTYKADYLNTDGSPVNDYLFEGSQHTSWDGMKGLGFDVDSWIPFAPTPAKGLSEYWDYIDENYCLPIIGKWVTSSNATATNLVIKPVSTCENVDNVDVKLYAYEDGIQALTTERLNEKQPADFAQDRQDADANHAYFVRLPYAADQLNFELTTYEPGSTLIVTLDGVELTTTSEETTAGVGGNQIRPDNNLENPARSIFTLPEESLAKLDYCKGSAKYNVLTFTVTAPNGDSDKAETYTVYVQRLAEPKMTAKPGNTPYGMIYREYMGNPDSKRLIEAAISKYKAGSGYSLEKVGLVSEANNGGYVYNGQYRFYAWGWGNQDAGNFINYDEEPAAIFVYQNSQFVLPGFEVTNGLGNRWNESTDNMQMTWELPLVTVQGAMTPDKLRDVDVDNPGEGYERILLKGNANDVVSLQGLNVKPGVYTLTYVYTDPYDENMHDIHALGFKRTVIVLPLPGDVDMDGDVTVADGALLQRLLKEGFFTDSETWTDVTKSLYTYRVCNIDNTDSALDADDVDKLLNGYEIPSYGQNWESAAYYIAQPLMDPADYMPERTPVTTPSSGEHAELSVEYLGTQDETGSFDKTAQVDYNGAEDPSVFWMGVKLEQADKFPDVLQGELTTFTFTLTYNSTYVAPWSDEEMDWKQYIMSVNPQWEGYQLAASSRVNITPTVHGTKATSTLEGGTLREVRFSVTLPQGATGTTLHDGYVLKIPFYLVAYPETIKGEGVQNGDGEYYPTSLIEATMGMRDFVVTTADGTGAWDNSNRLSENSMTTNLAGNMQYTDEGGKILIGVDKDPGQHVTKADRTDPVYGDEATLSLVGVAAGGRVVDETTLPPGMRYNSARAWLEGTPSKAGRYTFYVDDGGVEKKFYVVVKKAPLTLMAVDVDMYYGENANNTTVQTFTYNKDEIKALDSKGYTNDGTESRLEAMLTDSGEEQYTRPSIKLVVAVDNEKGVDSTTVPGTYTVLLQGGKSTNYEFQFVMTTTTDDSQTQTEIGEVGNATLTVHKRPIRIQKLTKTSLGELLENSQVLGVSGKVSVNVEGKEDEFTTYSVLVDSKGCYQNIPLTIGTDTAPVTIVNNDTVTLNYTALARDVSGLEQSVEMRPADVTSIDLPAGVDRNDYYTLVFTNDSSHVPNDVEGQVQVSKRNLAADGLTFVRKPDGQELEYEYYGQLALGSSSSGNELTIRIKYESDTGDGTELSLWREGDMENLYNTYGLTVQWVNKKDDVPAVVTGVDTNGHYTDMAYNAQHLTVKDHDGHYICISVPTGVEDKNGVMGYQRLYIGPYHVAKKTITLTPVAQERYYGEDNADWDFTYATADLAEIDRHAGNTGTRSTLAALKLEGYQEPTVKYSTTATLAGEDVSAGTGVGQHYILLYGAESDNYTFRYNCTGWTVNETTTTVTPVETKETVVGYTTLQILKRPIMVTNILASAGTVLYDTDRQTAKDKIDAAKATLVGGSTDEKDIGFQAMLPVANTDYYTGSATSAFDVVRYNKSLKNLDAVFAGDRVTLQYQADFVHDEDHEDAPFWDLNGQSSKEVTVNVSKLALTGEGSGNYELVYPNYAAATNGYAYENGSRTTTVGTVAAQMITKIQVLSAPKKMSYTYGDTLNLEGLKVELFYGENNSIIVEWSSRMISGVLTNTFADRGLSVHWRASDGETATNEQPLYVNEHNAILVVTGQASADSEIIVATADRVDMKVKVSKAALALTTVDQERAYGEDNDVYKFTFNLSDLALWDRQLIEKDFADLVSNGVVTLSASQTNVGVESVLKAINGTGNYKGPYFRLRNDGVDRETDVGTYVLQLIADKDAMVNYNLNTSNGTITVKKRVIAVTNIIKAPIYSVSENAAPGTKYHAILSDGSGYQGNAKEMTVVLGPSSLPQSSAALVGDDVVTIDMELQFDTISISSSAPVTVTGMSLAADNSTNDNYDLQNRTLTATGEVHESRIESIKVQKKPSMTGTYGNLQNGYLNLDMQLLVKLEDSVPGSISLQNCLERGYNVSINYYDHATAPTDPAVWASIPTAYPKAESGDMFTRTKKSGNGFARHGDYLIISAESAPGTGVYVQPVVIGPFQVLQLPLMYTLEAEDKYYNGSCDANGTIALTNVWHEGAHWDQVWVDNGIDHSNTTLSGDSDYRFSNGTYGPGYKGITFTFTNANTGNWQVEVTQIALKGPDANNYVINEAVRTNTQQIPGRDEAPYANIWPSQQRPVPEVTITLEVDPNTNAVTVSTDKPANSFDDPNDFYKGELKYQYRILYLNEDGEVTAMTEYQDSPVFSELDRTRYVGAEVRLAATHNYEESLPTRSSQNFADAIVESLTDLPESGEKDRIVERKPGPVVKTYTYKIELWSSVEKKESSGESEYVVELDSVWYTDIFDLKEQKDLDRLVDNLNTEIYTGYFWDKEKSKGLSSSFPIDLTQEIEVEYTQKNEDGTTETISKVMNAATDALVIYVTAERKSGGGSSHLIPPSSVKIDSSNLVGRVGDAPVQLELIFEPERTNNKQVFWSSSDESVAIVSRNGVVTFVGPGVATITVRTWNYLTDSIEVQVLSAESWPFADTMFNAQYAGSYMEMGTGLFEPEKALTRQELVLLMEHFFQEIEGYDLRPESQFLDVLKNASYYEELRTLNIWGIVNGVSEELFAPDWPATRAEISIILCRMLMLPIETDLNAPHAFNDAGPEDTWAWAYIDALAKAGIAYGTGDDCYAPNRVLTRAEVAAFVARVLATEVDLSAEGVIVPLDVAENHWAYKEILRAVNSGAVLLTKKYPI